MRLIDAVRGIVFDAYIEVEADLVLAVVVSKGKTGRGVGVKSSAQSLENAVDLFQSRVDLGQVLVRAQDLLLQSGLGRRLLIAPAPAQGTVVLELLCLGLKDCDLVADGNEVVQGTASAEKGGLLVQRVIQVANGAIHGGKLALQMPVLLCEPGDPVADKLAVKLPYLVQTP